MNSAKFPSFIFISGMPGVGKTTIARSLLKQHGEFLVLQEVDIIREALRAYTEYCNFYKLMQHRTTPDTANRILNSASYHLTICEYLLQCELLIPSIITICKRLQNKRITAIIEGVNLDFVSMHSSKSSENNFFSLIDAVYINLSISESQEYIQRLQNKYQNSSTMNLSVVEMIVARERYLSNRLKEFIIQNPECSNIYDIDISTRTIFPHRDKLIKYLLDF